MRLLKICASKEEKSRSIADKVKKRRHKLAKLRHKRKTKKTKNESGQKKLRARILGSGPERNRVLLDFLIYNF